MPVIAKLRNLNIAPRKVRMVADLIRREKAKEALVILRFAIKRSAEPIEKLLRSAISNAKHNFNLTDESNLYIAKITVDEGRKMKRWEPRARGSASEIQKKTSHITLILDEIEKIGKKAAKQAEKMVKPESAVDIAEPTIKTSEEVKEIKPKFKSPVKERKPKITSGIRKIFRRNVFTK